MSAPAGEGWQARPDVRAAQRRAVTSLFLTQVLGGLGMGAGMTMGSLLAYEVTSDEGVAGVSRIVAALSVAVLAVPLASFATRRGRRAALTTGLAVAVVGALLLVAAARWHSLPLLMLGMFLFGGGTTANLQCRFAATDMAEPASRARTMSFVMWAATLGSVVGPLLAAPGGVVGRSLGLPPIAGSYLLASLGVGLAALVVWTTLRPDPMLVAREHTGAAQGASRRDTLTALRAIWQLPLARFALVTVVLNQMVMTAVMTLTPVHMSRGGHALAAVSLVLSGHVLGMYAFSPLVGWLVDRWGAVPVVWLCVAVHVAALTTCVLAHDHALVIGAGLFLLGLGWSCGMVAGSALVSAEVPAPTRAQAQGATDTLMNVGAAVAAGAAGPVLGAVGFAGLAVAAGTLLLPVVAMAMALVGRGAGARRLP